MSSPHPYCSCSSLLKLQYISVLFENMWSIWVKNLNLSLCGKYFTWDIPGSHLLFHSCSRLLISSWIYRPLPFPAEDSQLTGEKKNPVMYSLETCAIVFHHFSVILFPKAIHFFLPVIQILLCSDDVSQLRLISTSHQCTPPFQVGVIHKNINPVSKPVLGKLH